MRKAYRMHPEKFKVPLGAKETTGLMILKEDFLVVNQAPSAANVALTASCIVYSGSARCFLQVLVCTLAKISSFI